jgi:N-methylhydantoinase B
MHVGLNAADVALQAFNLALSASPNAPARRYLAGAGFESALANHLWSWTTPQGETDAFIVLDGNWVGGSGAAERDGTDLGRNPVGIDIEGSFPDIEILESWFPLLFRERRSRPGVEGAGEHRSGGGNQLSFQPHGIDEMYGTMFAMRRYLPLQGLGGGAPGACSELIVHRGGGVTDVLDVNATGIRVADGEWFQMRVASGGGFGDPLGRPVELVAEDVKDGRFSPAEAESVYGVVLSPDGRPELAATERRRNEIRQERLRRADPAVRPVNDEEAAAAAGGPETPLFVGVVQRGMVAYSEASGAPLAMAPSHWTDGCPVLIERRWSDDGPDVVYRSYLDPRTGRSLHVEVVLGGSPRSFEVNPRRWTTAGQ